jgi:hypothetical protein
MSKVGKILEFIRGSHVLNTDGLSDYYPAAKVRDLLRVKNPVERFTKIKTTLNPYRVTVTLESDERIRIRRHDIGKELFL